MNLPLSDYRDAALAVGNWQAAAQAILAHPASKRLSRDTLTRVATFACAHPPSGDRPEYLLAWVSKIIDVLGDGGDHEQD